MFFLLLSKERAGSILVQLVLLALISLGRLRGLDAEQLPSSPTRSGDSVERQSAGAESQARSGEASATLPSTQPVAIPSTQRLAATAPEPKTTPAAQATDRGPFEGLDHEGTPTKPAMESQPPRSTVTPGRERPLPDYDGRASQGLGAGEALIWVPRTLFLPVHLTLEYLVRRPLIGLTALLEKHHVIEKARELVTFSDSRGGQGVVLPTFFWDFGTQITVGLLANYSNILGSKSSVGGSFALWPNSTGQASLSSTFEVFHDESGTVTLRADYVDRRDFRFFGLGPDSPQVKETFFRKQQLQGEVSLRAALSGLNRVGVGAFYRTAETLSTNQTPSLETKFDVDDPSAVPGWDRPFHLLELQTKFELDSRAPERIFTPGSGVRLEAFGSFAIAPHQPSLNFFKWGAEAAGFWDFSGNNHVVAFRLYAAALEATGSDPVPFIERLQLGGLERLRGFSIGRFHGESALVATASYRYPIWLFLDADLFVGIGNVFDGRWERLHIKRMVMNWGIAFRTSLSRITSLDLLLAFGTNRLQQWDDEFHLDNVRFTIAVNQGF